MNCSCSRRTLRANAYPVKSNNNVMIAVFAAVGFTDVTMIANSMDTGAKTTIRCRVPQIEYGKIQLATSAANTGNTAKIPSNKTYRLLSTSTEFHRIANNTIAVAKININGTLT